MPTTQYRPLDEEFGLPMQQGGILQGKSGSKFCPKDGCTIEQVLVTMLRMTQRRNQGGKSCVL